MKSGLAVKFIENSKNELAAAITQSWNEQALECYAIGCDCQKCSLRNGQYSFKCQMPKVIDMLINIVGKPKINIA